MKGWDVSSRTLLTVRFSAGEDRSRFETMIERLEDGRGVFLSVAVWMNTKLARLGFHFRHILESPPRCSLHPHARSSRSPARYGSVRPAFRVDAGFISLARDLDTFAPATLIE